MSIHSIILHTFHQQLYAMCIPTNTSTTPTKSSSPQVVNNEFVNKPGRAMKRPRRSVCFAEDVSTIERDSVSTEELDTMWYQPKELHRLKLQMRDHILAIQISEEKRGLERYTIERSRNKQLGIRCTVLAYKKGMSEESISHVSKKCSSWFHKRAFVQAFQDYCEVYHPEMIGLVPQTSNTPPKLDFGTSNKRSVEEDFEQRRVRIRTV
jgi:hypothetical protein